MELAYKLYFITLAQRGEVPPLDLTDIWPEDNSSLALGKYYTDGIPTVSDKYRRLCLKFHILGLLACP